MIRLNINSELGQYVRDKYKKAIVPTFIVFDKHGNTVWEGSGSTPKLETILSLGL